MKTTKILVWTVFMLNSLACRSVQALSSVKEFSPIPKGEEGPVGLDFKLSRARDIPHTVTRSMPAFSEQEQRDEFFDPSDLLKSYMKVSFGRISEAQFAQLKSTYFDNTQLSYSSTRNYELVDFMPPQIQAMDGFRFASERVISDIPYYDATREKKFYTYSTLSNCWNTAYEILRGDSKKTSLFYVNGGAAQGFFTDDSYSRKLKVMPLNPSWQDAGKDRNEGLKPFDILLVYGNSFGASSPSLQHVAVFIDDDFYFEKTGPDSTLNYRFTTFDTIAGVYGAYNEARIELRRFQGKTLPQAREVFSYQATGTALPSGFASDELTAVLPTLSQEISGFWPSNFEETSYRILYLFADAPMVLDTATQRYKLDAKALQQALKGERLKD